MEQRRRTRVASRKQISLAWPGGSCRGELANVSLNGCLVEAPRGARPPLDAAVDVCIHLESDTPEYDIALRGTVVREESGCLAVGFTEVPADGFPHLFRLVQYNAPDPEQIEQELGSSAFGAGAPARH